MQNKFSLKQKFFLILFGIFIAFLLAEVLFRIGGFIASKTIIQSVKIIKNANNTILCIGDSSTYGFGASNTHKFSYPAQLQALLDEKVRNSKFDVINIGVPGMNSSQVLHRFKDNLLEYKPDIVIMMIGLNDPWNLEENNILKNYNENILEKLSLGFNLLLNKSRVYRFFKLIYVSSEFVDPEKRSDQISSQKQELTLPDFDDKALSKGFEYSLRNPARTTALYNSIANNIIEMKQIADNQHVVIIFMKYHNIGWGRPEKLIHDTYANLNVPVVDQLSAFEKANELGLNVRSKDRWHPNDLGYLIMSRNIFNKMVDLKIIDSKPIEIFG